MTVSALIALLTAMDPNARALVLGYESGYDDIKGVKLVRVTDNGPGGVSYFGRYNDAESYHTQQPFDAVVIGR